jgi:citrate lyase subunit beta/citryl-CoA lyase
MTLTSALGRARTLLFAPGHRPERFVKALGSGADAVVLDLEDSVPPASKHAARAAIGDAWPTLKTAPMPVVIRINAIGAPAGSDDLSWLARLSAPAGLMVAKAETLAQLTAIARALPGLPLLPLIETAAGYLALPEIAGAPGVDRLVVGHIDFMADTGLQCGNDERELDPLRFAVAMHTRVHRLAPAVDGVTVAIDDEAQLRGDTLRALAFGFGGKLCIHPRQVAAIHDAMRPSAEDIAWARRVVAADEAAGGAAVQVDGRMVDLPVVLRARQLLARARDNGG